MKKADQSKAGTGLSVVSGVPIHLGYRAWLDGLRGVAITCVFIQHVQIFLYDRKPIIKQFGGLGVDVFFVLSGFLITTLMLEEYDKSKRINLKAFYARRALRLLPALFFFFDMRERLLLLPA